MYFSHLRLSLSGKLLLPCICQCHDHSRTAARQKWFSCFMSDFGCVQSTLSVCALFDCSSFWFDHWELQVLLKTETPLDFFVGIAKKSPQGSNQIVLDKVES
jgi:hypothetical protein